MNTEYLFKLFKDSVENKSDDQIEMEIMESAHYNAKMFIKYITNLKNFQLKLLAISHQRKNDPESYERDKQTAETLGYAKAFFHVSQINIFKRSHIDDLDLINPFDFSYCLQLTKHYFLAREEYDQVAFISTLQDFVETRYEKLQITE